MAKDSNFANAMAIFQMYGADTDLKTFCQQNKINYTKFYQYLREKGVVQENGTPAECEHPRICPVEITGTPTCAESPVLESAEISFGQGLTLIRRDVNLSELVTIIVKVSKAIC